MAAAALTPSLLTPSPAHWRPHLATGKCNVTIASPHPSTSQQLSKPSQASGTPKKARVYPASWPSHIDVVENTVGTWAGLRWGAHRGRFCLERRRRSQWASAGCRAHTFVISESEMVHACDVHPAVTASPMATASVDLVRRGADKLAAGRHHLAPRPAGLFRACRDDWRSAGRPERREAEKYRGMGCYPARLLRTPQLAFFTGKNNPPGEDRGSGAEKTCTTMQHEFGSGASLSCLR